jgi:hypothetical protein
VSRRGEAPLGSHDFFTCLPMTATHEQNCTIPTASVRLYSWKLGSQNCKPAFTIDLRQSPVLGRCELAVPMAYRERSMPPGDDLSYRRTPRSLPAVAPDDGGGRGGIIDSYIVGDRLFVWGPKHRMLHVPRDSIGALRGQPEDAVRKFVIDPDGSFLYWPELDVHLGWNQLLQAVDPADLRKAQQRSAGFNQRYGAVIRKVREAAGIKQSKVEGLTERQLRRIERGESRATTAALTALAKAHGLDANAYMERLTKAMK